MFPIAYGNPAIPYFEEAKRAAAGIAAPGEKGDYTAAFFQADHPEFYVKTQEAEETVYTSMLPEDMLSMFVDAANTSVIPSQYGNLWRIAAGLYVAHFAALYLSTYADGSTPTQAASNAEQTGTVKTASMGDTSISYDNSAVTAGTEKWGTWNATKYGAQLVTFARMLGIGGIYVI